MTVVAETRILPETLETTWQRMREQFGNHGDITRYGNTPGAKTERGSPHAKRKQRH
jgi:hypothetical protein